MQPNIPRLNHLITVLEDVERANLAFNLDAWIDDADGTLAGKIKSHDSGDTKETCGTACCAFGYAALDPTFRAQGLTLKVQYETPGGQLKMLEPETIAEFNKILRRDGIIEDAWPSFDGLGDAWKSAERFFDLDNDAATYLFDPGAYGYRKVLPGEVIARVREVIANNGKAPDEAED